MIAVYWHHAETSGGTTTSVTTDISDFVNQVIWSGAATEASRTMELQLINSPHDKQMQVPTLSMGDVVTLYEGGIRLFYGRVTARERIGEIGNSQYTCKDYMNNLLKSKISKKYKNKTAEYIAKDACKLVGISTGTLVKTKVKIAKHYGTENPVYNVIMAAYKKAALKTGIQYFPRMNGNKFEVAEKGQLVGKGYNSQTGLVEEGYVLSQDTSITGSRITENIDDMVNRVAIYNKTGKQIGSVSNASWVKAYGVYQEALTQEKGSGKKEARAKLKGSSKEIEIEAIGDQRCIAGAGIHILDSISGITGVFWIESDSHTWSGGKHTMSITLAFKNTTESPDISYDSGKNSSKKSNSGYVMTNELSGKKVKALFTGYYPANNKMEGGYYDAQGNRLDPKKKTCAAPKSIKFGTQIQVLSTHTGRDKKVYKVTDRGGAINVVGGRYHFDLLFATKKEANAFGKRKGYAIIGDGSGFKVKKTSGTTKGDKVVTYAKKFVGKVRYRLKAASPQKGRSDCSGYVMYVYKHAVGKKLPHYSVDQAKLGKKISKMSQMRPGDIIIMHTGWRHNAKSTPDHVGIYAGNNKILQVGHSGCTYRNVSTIRGVFLYARRIL